MANDLQPSPPEGHQSPFELIRRTNPAGVEFWSSRDFAQVLGYTDYRNFEQVIQKARTACFNSAQPIEDHFVDITEMVEIGSSGEAAGQDGIPIPVCLLPSRSKCRPVKRNRCPGADLLCRPDTPTRADR